MLTALIAMLSACAGPEPAAAPPGRMPPDFALVVTVIGDPLGSHPMRESARYILQPSRDFHAARGRGAVGGPTASGYFPHASRRLSPAQMEYLHGFIDYYELAAEPTSPNARVILDGETLRRDTVLIEVELTAFGRTHRYITTPAESPPTARLLEMLVLLRQDLPPDADPTPLRQP